MIKSVSSIYYAILQGDGNFVIYYSSIFVGYNANGIVVHRNLN